LPAESAVSFSAQRGSFILERLPLERLSVEFCVKDCALFAGMFVPAQGLVDLFQCIGQVAAVRRLERAA
jgi:hypothetical protein